MGWLLRGLCGLAMRLFSWRCMHAGDQILLYLFQHVECLLHNKEYVA